MISSQPRPLRRLAAAASLLAALGLLGLAVRGQDPPEAPVLEPTAPVLVTSDATTEDLGWLTGHWTGQGLGGAIEVVWTRPSGGSLMGCFRLVADERAALYEFLLLEDTPRGVRLTFRHYGPGHRPWEKDAPLTFLLVQSGPGRAEFQSEDPRQSPIRVVYSSNTGADATLSVVVENPEHLPEPRSFEIAFRRAGEALR